MIVRLMLKEYVSHAVSEADIPGTISREYINYLPGFPAIDCIEVIVSRRALCINPDMTLVNGYRTTGNGVGLS